MKIIAISSFKGGTAKTSTALHIGSALSKFQRRKFSSLILMPKQISQQAWDSIRMKMTALAPVLQGNKQLKEVIQNDIDPQFGSHSC